jgi:hypothetical protein
MARCILAIVVAALGGCFSIGDADRPISVEGGHKWDVWSRAAEATLPRVRGAT